MRVNYSKGNGQIFVSIVGAIDNDNTQDLNEHLGLILQEQFEEAVFDFSLLSYICSSGIGKLLLFYKNIRDRGRKMKVTRISDQVFDLFRFTNMDLLFPIER